jgi:hypothetical protein
VISFVNLQLHLQSMLLTNHDIATHRDQIAEAPPLLCQIREIVTLGRTSSSSNLHIFKVICERAGRVVNSTSLVLSSQLKPASDTMVSENLKPYVNVDSFRTLPLKLLRWQLLIISPISFYLYLNIGIAYFSRLSLTGIHPIARLSDSIGGWN